MLAVYVSGHGFGHATRTAEVLRRVRRRAPELRISVTFAGPEPLFRRVLGAEVEIRCVACDVGLAQKGALEIDEPGTLAAWRSFASTWDDRVRSEAAWLRASGAELVLGDIPPLAFAAAAEAGVPSMALGNFSWDWIYRHLSQRQPELRQAADAAATAYSRCELLLRLPFAGDMRAFPYSLDVPLVARRPTRPRVETRGRLGLDDRPAVLLSFGGLGLPGFDAAVLDSASELLFVSGGEWPEGRARRCVSAAMLEAQGLGYEDLVGAVDVVVTKPGYGIVADAVGARTRLVYTERGDFPEYPIIVEAMSRLLPCVHVSNADLLAGRLAEPIRRVLAMPFPDPPDMSGAEVVASNVLARVGRSVA